MIPDFPAPSPQPLVPALNVIVDVDVAAAEGWTIPDLTAACLSGGARFLQLRAKTASSGAFLDLAHEFVARCREAGAVSIVNDRADIARLAGASGVHLGQEDLAPADARAVLGAGAIVGLSTHSAMQIDRSLTQPVNYIAIGPVFGTTTKSTGYESVGLEMVRHAADRAMSARLPLVAIGGITLDTAVAVIAAGAAAVAVIRDVFATGDPESRVRAYVERLTL